MVVGRGSVFIYKWLCVMDSQKMRGAVGNFRDLQYLGFVVLHPHCLSLLADGKQNHVRSQSKKLGQDYTVFHPGGWEVSIYS